MKYEFKPYGFAFQPNSPYLRLFNYYINRLKENGALEKAMKPCKPPPQKCTDQTGEALGINNCFGAFLVMVVGIGAGSLIFVMEFFLKNKTTDTLPQSSFESRIIEDEEKRATPVQLDVRRLRSAANPIKHRREGSLRQKSRWLSAQRRVSKMRNTQLKPSNEELNQN